MSCVLFEIPVLSLTMLVSPGDARNQWHSLSGLLVDANLIV